MVPELDYTPTLPVLLKRLVARYGDHELVVSPERRYTYREADLLSRSVAGSLIDAGCVKGTRVAFMFGNTPEWVILWLAICRIGAIAMPLSTMYRPAEVRQVLGLADAEILVTPRFLLGRDQTGYFESAIAGLDETRPPYRLRSLPFLRRIMVSGGEAPGWAEPLDLTAGEVDEEYLDAVESAVHPADTMLAVFTSGTTAEPKGVLHTQGAWVRHTANCAEHNDEPFDQRVYAGMPFFWIGGVSTTIGIAMQRGNTLLCVEKPDPKVVAEFLVQEKATRALMWPTQLDRIKMAWAESGQPVESLPAFARPELQEPVEPGRRAQSLGMTETLAAYTVSGPADHRIPDEFLGAYGFKVPYLQYRIVDPETGEPLTDGKEGEICVRGYSLMVGMCRRERHEYLDDDGWYHTGDRGILKGPYVYFNGRLKDLIKSSGANVSPREVEAVINGAEGVLTSVVVGIPDPVRQEVVAALVAPQAGAELRAEELAARCRELLSQYKVPRRIAILSDGEVPVGATGKAQLDQVRALIVERGVEV